MNKNDAAKYLGIGVRSLERYTSDGRIVAGKVKGRTGFVADYAPEDLERLKAELEAPPEAPPVPELEAAPVPPPSSATSLARLPRQSRAIVSTAAVGHSAAPPARERLAPSEAAHKLLLSLEECQTLTGLSRGVLRAAIDGGTLKGQRIGRGWKVKRSDLEKYVEGL
jgi:excisionase family DNA binding protein